MQHNIEKQRLKDEEEGKVSWKKWGPYLTERQWGTVREDYSADGSAWESVSHDMARSNAYRWGEEGIGGVSDGQQLLNFSWAFWNGKDPILKERIFGLTGNEGNHGEDVKEMYYYLDSTPTHSYMKMLYKYPQNPFPYKQLVDENRHRGKQDLEYEILDTGIFDNDEYYDIFLEYAKVDEDDLLFKAVIENRGDREEELYLLPTAWFRNTWRLQYTTSVPTMVAESDTYVAINHEELGNYHLYFEDGVELAFCDNETNRKLLYGGTNNSKYTKDGINDYVVNGHKEAINVDREGTKVSGIYKVVVPANGKKEVCVRLSKKELSQPFVDFHQLFAERLQQADDFYEEIQAKIPDEEDDLINIQRQAFGGLMWTKQFYYYNVKEWMDGDEGRSTPPKERKQGRNQHWRHLHNADIISMPDKWEYPWYAAWDLAFHCIPIARIDADFAKKQLLLLLDEWYIHPNGQIPAYEWNFSDVNPPVHAWAVLRVFHIDKKQKGSDGDLEFLEQAFHKLMLNFTWWVNRKDSSGNNIFEGGFLGLDNIGVFDRSRPLPTGGKLEQADGTSWMAMFALNMLRISLDLATENKVYQEMAMKFLDHFLYIAEAIHDATDDKVSLWDDEDNFYYDILHMENGPTMRLKIRSMVGIIPLFAVETLKSETHEKLHLFRDRLDFYQKVRPKLARLVSRWDEIGKGERRLFSLMRGFRMKKLLERVLDEEEFLSDYGIRALSKHHKENPYEFKVGDEVFSVGYNPGESDSYLFGGNSNWRGPIWFPVNYLILESLWKFDFYYDDNFTMEFPTGSKNHLTIPEVTRELSKRMIGVFTKDEEGKRAVYNRHPKMQNDPHFKDYVLFYEYFHGDNGAGLGASHQTGWTALVADIIHKMYN
ncbi:MAG: glucosidase [Cytophagales bacterium]|nr:glucosidase [Cytophagales bacterium]